MQDLIDELKNKAGLTEDQAIKALQTIKEYIHSKVPPMFSGMVDNFLGVGNKNKDAHGNDDFLDRANSVSKEATEKIEHIAAEAKVDMNDFSKEASEKIDQWAGKAEAAALEAVNKLKDMMNDPKKSQ